MTTPMIPVLIIAQAILRQPVALRAEGGIGALADSDTIVVTYGHIRWGGQQQRPIFGLA